MATLLLLAFATLGAQTSVDDVATPVAPTPTTSTPGRTLGVLPLVVRGLQLNDAQRLNLGLRARLSKQSRFDLQDQETSDLLVTSAQSLGLTCDVASAPCGVQLGQIVGVDHVLLGTATLLDDHVGLVLRLVDVEKEAVSAEVSALLPVDGGAQMKALDGIVAELIAPSARLGALQMTVGPEGARVLVDGNQEGRRRWVSPSARCCPVPTRSASRRKVTSPSRAASASPLARPSH